MLVTEPFLSGSKGLVVVRSTGLRIDLFKLSVSLLSFPCCGHPDSYKSGFRHACFSCLVSPAFSVDRR
jgi:hypothetical protein